MRCCLRCISHRMVVRSFQKNFLASWCCLINSMVQCTWLFHAQCNIDKSISRTGSTVGVKNCMLHSATCCFVNIIPPDGTKQKSDTWDVYFQKVQDVCVWKTWSTTLAMFGLIRSGATLEQISGVSTFEKRLSIDWGVKLAGNESRKYFSCTDLLAHIKETLRIQSTTCSQSKDNSTHTFSGRQ